MRKIYLFTIIAVWSSLAYANIYVEGVVLGNLVSRLDYDRHETYTNITYNYELYSPQSDTIPIAKFAIAISRKADLTQIVGPTGWTITYKSGDPFVMWTSPDPTMDIKPGSHRSFSFVSQLFPGDQPFVGLPKKTSKIIFNSLITTSAPSDPKIPKP